MLVKQWMQWVLVANEMKRVLHQLAAATLQLQIEDESGIVKLIDCRGHVIFKGAREHDLTGADCEETMVENGERDVASSVEASQARVAVTSSWLAIKELTMLLATWVAASPLPSSDCRDGMFDLRSLEECGALFLRILAHSKHNGVIDKTKDSMLLLCETLARADAPALRELVVSWTEQVLQQVEDSDGSTESWIRRYDAVYLIVQSFFRSTMFWFSCQQECWVALLLSCFVTG